MNAPLFELPFTGYGLVCAFGAAVGLALTLPGTLLAGRGWAAWVRFAVCVLFFGWLGARLMYAVPDLLMGLLNELGVIQEHNSVYLNDIGSAVPALFFWEGGYSLAGAIPGAILGAWIAEKWTGAPCGFFRDRLALTVPVFVLAERLAEHGTGIGTGVEVSSDWLIGTGLCVREGGAAFHPLYLYEALLAAAVLAVMAVQEFRRLGRSAGGDRLRFFLVIFCLPMVVLEAFRPLTGHMIIHFVNVTQIAMMALALAPVIRWSIRLGRGGRPAAVKGAVLGAGWFLIAAGLALSVWCIFGMEKDWVSRGLAYILIALAMAVIGAVTGVVRRYAGSKGGPADGSREDPAHQ